MLGGEELTSLLPPPDASPREAGGKGMSASSSGSSLPMPLHAAGQIIGLTVRRARRRSALLLSAVKGAIPFPAPKAHEPMSSWGCFLFLSNLIMGPGILGLPTSYRNSGVFWSTFWTCAFAAASVLACVFIAHATRIFRQERLRTVLPPGAMEHTLDHQPHLEMENLVRGVSNTPVWVVFQFCFLFSMLLMGVTCIVVTAQGCDQLSVMIFGNAWGLQVTPRPRFVASCPHAWACGGSAPFSTVAAQPGGTIISAGYLLTVALTAPMAMIDISEGFQFASYAISLACLVWLIVKFWVLAAHGGASGDAGDNVFPPVFTWHTGLALEVNFWNWAISFAVPMFLDEKGVDVPLAEPITAAFAHRAALDIMLGYAGAAAFPRMPASSLNVLQAMSTHSSCGTATRCAGVLFVVASLVSNIVDYAMVSVRNIESHVGATAANAIGVGLPFAVAWGFYFGASFAELVSLASPLLNGAVQFIVPAALFYAYAAREKSPRLPMMGLSASTQTWRYVALALTVVTCALISATYALTATAAAKAAMSADDYGLAGPAPAPAAAQTAR